MFGLKVFLQSKIIPMILLGLKNHTNFRWQNRKEKEVLNIWKEICLFI